MAGSMNRAPLLAGMILLATISSAQGQALGDPTRPANAPAAVAATGGGEATASGLQTIIRRKGAKPAAVINGEYVALGGKIGDARLVKIGEDSVLLQGPEGREELRLYPGVEKKPSRPATPAKKSKRIKKAGDAKAAARNEDEARK